MLGDVLDALDGLERQDILDAAAEDADDILAVCNHPVFKLLVEFCGIFGEDHPVKAHHGHEDWNC